jgi:hypothetical protein
MDRRRYSRFVLRGSVSFSRQDRKGVCFEGNGFVRDISKRGVFVVTDTHVPLGEAVRLEMVFESPGTNSAMRMIAKGQVLRVESDSRSEHIDGFAAAISSLALSSGIPRGESQGAKGTLGGKQPC